MDCVYIKTIALLEEWHQGPTFWLKIVIFRTYINFGVIFRLTFFSKCCLSYSSANCFRIWIVASLEVFSFSIQTSDTFSHINYGLKIAFLYIYAKKKKKKKKNTTENPVHNAIRHFSCLLLPCFIEMLVFYRNSVDPDQSDLGLHCLQMSLLWDARHTWINPGLCIYNEPSLQR